jgi:hypothetical protein
MTSVGHALLGTAIGLLCMPQQASAGWKVGYVVAFLVLPNIPDLPVAHWGHHRYDISHSLFVNLLLCLIMVALLGWLQNIRHFIGDGKVTGAAVAAWSSHIAWILYTTMGTAWPSSGPYLMRTWPYPFRGLRWRRFHRFTSPCYKNARSNSPVTCLWYSWHTV